MATSAPPIVLPQFFSCDTIISWTLNLNILVDLSLIPTEEHGLGEVHIVLQALVLNSDRDYFLNVRILCR